jgi:hypothetical protein
VVCEHERDGHGAESVQRGNALGAH